MKGKLHLFTLFFFLVICGGVKNAIAQPAATRFVFPVLPDQDDSKNGRWVDCTSNTILSDCATKPRPEWNWRNIYRSYANSHDLAGDPQSNTSSNWFVQNDFGSYCASCWSHPGYHCGQDWNRVDGDDSGSRVYAIADGIVTNRQRLVDRSTNTSLGWGVTIRHKLPAVEDLSRFTRVRNGSSISRLSWPTGQSSMSDTVWSAYVHMSEVDPAIQVGEIVHLGQYIGPIGNFNGPHLHFEMHWREFPHSGMPGVLYGTYHESQQFLIDNGFLNPTDFILAHSSPYTVDDAFTCTGPVQGGLATNWVYTCPGVRNAFQTGETAVGFMRLSKIRVDHHYKVETYRDGTYQWYWSGDWNRVGEWGWNSSFFFPNFGNVYPGNWEFRLSVETLEGWKMERSLSFTVTNPAGTPPYSYNGGFLTCLGPITGGADTNWYYTCQNPTASFRVGQTAFAFIRIQNVTRDHRFRVITQIRNTDGSWREEWQWTADWNRLNWWRWDYSHFWPSYSNIRSAGRRRFVIQIDVGDGRGFQQLDAVEFNVTN